MFWVILSLGFGVDFIIIVDRSVRIRRNFEGVERITLGWVCMGI